MYNFKKIEDKWQKKWKFPSKKSSKKKYYVLEMLPYPSAYGLHMGHARNYTIGDVLARYKRMNGFNVLYPMGYDSFGLPAENAAIKEGIHPLDYTEKAIKNYIHQQKKLGLSYDWDRIISSHRQDYYKWDQWIFLEFFKRGLAYKKKSFVNFCPKCNTVLANEQVEQGKCWRHKDTDVEMKELEQWFFKTTKYADKLLKDIEKLNWPSKIKDMQINWIGKKEWIDIEYKIEGVSESITVSTTRPDTNFGATFVVLAPEHSLLSKDLIPKEKRKEVKDYINYSKKKTEEERIKEGTKKTGVFTGLYCINQLTKKKMPIWVSDFILASVGTGAVVGVPGHDLRDFEFAKEFDLPIIRVVVGPDGDKSEITKKEQVQEEEGTMINSGFLNGLNIHEATKKVMKYIEKNKWGKREFRYHLHDWLISRQRYWGCPIPIIYCDKCGIVPAKIPVKLPKKVNFKSGGNPLETNKEFVNVKCPKCNGKARRETDTMDTFVDSSWYFLRYIDNKNDKKVFSKDKVNYWLPIDQYIGGREHATGHLIYFRFFTKVFQEMGLLNFSEPALRLFNQGDVNKDGVRMSKSKGNVIDPMDMVNQYGADSLRFYLMFLSSPDSVFEWDDTGIKSVSNFLNKFYELSKFKGKGKEKDKIVLSKINSLIEIVTGNIEDFKYNRALIGIMNFTNYLHKNKDYISSKVFNDSYKILLTLSHPFIPHLTMELNCDSKWPKANKKLINKEIEFSEEFLQVTINDIHEIIKLINKKPKNIKLSVAESWKYSFYKNLKKEFQKSRDFNVLIKKLMIKEHGKDISRIIASCIKNLGKIPNIILSQSKELEILNENKKLLEKEFNCSIEISKNDTKAYPGKVSILIGE